MHAAVLKNSRGNEHRSLRVFGSYAIVYLLDGSGEFRDGSGFRQPVSAGDCLLIYPDVPHVYGPGKGDHWSEIYVVFDGPVFDLWRTVGILNPTYPIYRLEPVDTWRARIEEAVTRRELSADVFVSRFLCLVTSIAATSATASAVGSREPWRDQALRLLATELGSDLSVEGIADRVGLSYEVFRKRFAAATGISPVRYRTKKRIDAACEILQRTDIPIKQIAAHLGFSNEFNFSRRFKQETGQGPREYRKSGGHS
jgi:AraC-like DNA-binding protein